MVVEITDSETMANVHEAHFAIQSDDPTTPTPIVLPIAGCTFEASGRHQVTVSIDNELIALAVFDVELVEE